VVAGSFAAAKLTQPRTLLNACCVCCCRAIVAPWIANCKIRFDERRSKFKNTEPFQFQENQFQIKPEELQFQPEELQFQPEELQFQPEKLEFQQDSIERQPRASRDYENSPNWLWHVPAIL
jgi:hypothetical protein